jgi:hypothetical protein
MDFNSPSHVVIGLLQNMVIHMVIGGLWLFIPLYELPINLHEITYKLPTNMNIHIFMVEIT